MNPLPQNPFLCSVAAMLWVIVLLHHAFFFPALIPGLKAEGSDEEAVDRPGKSWVPG